MIANSGRDPSSRSASAAAFGTLTGSITTGTPAACGQVPTGREGVAREVAVEHQQSGPGDHRTRGAHVVRGERLGGHHVRDRDRELAGVVEHRHVGAGRAEDPADQPHVDARRGGGREQLVAQRVRADGRHEDRGGAEPGEVLGDVAAHATRRPDHVAGVAGAGHHRPGAASLDVHVRPADHDGTHVSFSNRARSASTRWELPCSATYRSPYVASRASSRRRTAPGG